MKHQHLVGALLALLVITACIALGFALGAWLMPP